MGTHNYGHYICYRRWRGTWWKANDEAVYTTSEEEVLSSPGTFMLFYELRNGFEEESKPLTNDEEYDDETNKTEDDETHDRDAKNGKEYGAHFKDDSPHGSSSSSSEDGDVNSTVSSWEDSRNDSEEESRELFPNAKFDAGEERAYHV
ncbi:hypothetical protein JCM33374_g1492 [Metschnikowia sp. JCM 33374]|nr:hypothetical protein JCM33374_g1492 [Metschnikowia sp. JCM 33374]